MEQDKAQTKVRKQVDANPSHIPVSPFCSKQESRPEIWGGIECTVNRVGSHYFDQLERNGHARRASDLNLCKELGFRVLRYPCLWERVAQGVHPDTQLNWSWCDERLSLFRTLGLTPIVGLLHHGSGPRFTHLLDPAFPQLFAQYALAFARRYPWVELYTPINEPLTTARFSALYGFWYPHACDDASFARALYHQCLAIGLAMRAIRTVNPSARLVQTEDLGKVYATEPLAYQAAFENERRWLTFDLLLGRVTETHAMWNFLRDRGQLQTSELHGLACAPCPPDIIGINHYLTSERYLDHRVEYYPGMPSEGNGRNRYVDIEAVRILPETGGPAKLLRETWDRFGVPMAVTEVHLGCTREEQMRWLCEVWQAANLVHSQGCDLRAVTVWSLFGAYNWNSLVTRDDHFYEPGVYDVRGPLPRPTALANMVEGLIQGNLPDHPLIETHGWWRRPERFLHTEEATRCALHEPTTPGVLKQNHELGAPGGQTPRSTLRPLLITGATGTLGRAFARMCEVRGIHYQLLGRKDLDIADCVSVETVLDIWKPWGVINTAGYVRVSHAEHEERACRLANVEGATNLAKACAVRGLSLVTYSSDLVFGGRGFCPYVESDKVEPLSVYGRSKADAELLVLALNPKALVIRTSSFFGPWDEHNFVTLSLRRLTSGEPISVADDLFISPTYVPDLVHASLDLLIDGEHGLWHVANQGAVSWAELARRAAFCAGVDGSRIITQSSLELGFTAPMPVYSVLGSERGSLLPSLDDAMSRYVKECQGVMF